MLISNGSLIGSWRVALVSLGAATFVVLTGSGRLAGLVRGLVDDAHHRLLECLPLEEKAVLVPDEVGCAQLEVVALHATLEEREDIAVIGICCKGETSAVVHVLFEFRGLVHAQLINSDLLLLALDVIIFLVFGASWEALPGQAAAQEVNQYVTNSFEVVSAALLVANVRADRGVPGGSCQVLALTEGNMLSLRILVALGQAEVNDVDVIFGALVAANQEVVWLDVSVDNALLVHFLNSVDLHKNKKATSNTCKFPRPGRCLEQKSA